MSPSATVPQQRVRPGNDRQVDPAGQYVLYWMTSFRRPAWNFSLQRAADWARQLQRPLLIFEALRCGYPWASDRIHRFVIQGMADHLRHFSSRNIAYYPYLEPQPGAGQGLLKRLAEQACVVVGDDFPGFFLPRMLRAAASVGVRLELVDSNGLFPIHATDRVFTVAHSFRRFLQKNLRPHLTQLPAADPLADGDLAGCDVPPTIQRRWPAADLARYADPSQALTDFPIDHDVPPAPIRGGPAAGQTLLRAFLRRKLYRYDEHRNHPDEHGGSGFSPYLHFGNLSAHQIFHDVMRRDGWTLDDLADRATGKREGWWHASPNVESFLDELITWREIGFNFCALRDDYDQFDSLPDWARATLEEHADDPREFIYSLEQFEAAETHDPLWNAAQRELIRDGRMHNYLRMLWGKKILHWTQHPRDALAIMIELNNKYALDGRDPNSYSGIFWVLGRYDRAWGPERKIFGKVRYMTSDSTAKKLRLKSYLATYGPR